MSELVLTEEEEREVQEGEAAGLLLDSPAYILAVERIRAQCAEGILTSAPDEPGVRERLYNLSRGLTAVTEELIAMQARGITVAENATLQTNDVEEDVQAEQPDVQNDY